MAFYACLSHAFSPKVEPALAASCFCEASRTLGVETFCGVIVVVLLRHAQITATVFCGRAGMHFGKVLRFDAGVRGDTEETCSAYGCAA
eukprot:14553395-Alexandrium_andersonii.AAC.1